VTATPTDENGDPSSECAPASDKVTVEANKTVELLLVSQCEGDPNGGLDVITALNDPPAIDDLELQPSKFITACEEVVLKAVASDPNGDVLSYEWEITAGPGGSISGTGPSVTFSPNGPGEYAVTLTVTDVYEASTSLSFPIHVSADDCSPKGAGTCSADNATCSSDADCVQGPILGFCVTRDDFPDQVCAYSTRRDTGFMNSCDGNIYGQCDVGEDCPTGMFCGGFAENWCVDGLGTCSPAFAQGCNSDADCVVERKNICQICGDGILQQSETDCPPGSYGPFCQGEHCDDGNTLSGDGCSASCQLEGRCTQFGRRDDRAPCATASDCEAYFQCTFEPCTCELP
jgi:cysteine-rich repeat protein